MMTRISAVALPSLIPGALVNPIHVVPSTLFHAAVSGPGFAGG